MPTLAELCQFLEEFAPLELAEDWDNVGLLIGDSDRTISKVLTCLTLTPDVAAEAIDQQFDLIVTHHPILFRPIQQITTETTEGRMLLKLIESKVAVYSPHTAYDNAVMGINQQIAHQLQLSNIKPLRLAREIGEVSTGSGRYGTLPNAIPFENFLDQVKQTFKLTHLESVPPTSKVVTSVGIACGSAGEFLDDARRQGCEVFITGETRFHTALDARNQGMGLILLGHYTSERFALETLADRIKQEIPALEVVASQTESDPLHRS